MLLAYTWCAEQRNFLSRCALSPAVSSPPSISLLANGVPHLNFHQLFLSTAEPPLREFSLSSFLCSTDYNYHLVHEGSVLAAKRVIEVPTGRGVILIRDIRDRVRGAVCSSSPNGRRKSHPATQSCCLPTLPPHLGERTHSSYDAHKVVQTAFFLSQLAMWKVLTLSLDACLAKNRAKTRGTMEIQFLRESLVKAETAALDKKGELVLGRRASRRQKRGMAQTYVVTWRDAETLEETTLPIAKYGLGRKVRDVFLFSGK